MVDYYQQRDVVLIDFPFTDLTTIKRRPALIISADWYNKLKTEVIVLALTSHISSSMLRDSFLLFPPDDVTCGLDKPSMVKLGNVMTLHKEFIIKKIGELPVPTFRKLIKGYLDVLGYPEFIK